MELALSRFDCYLAVAGGLEVDEPAADLGIAAAIISSFKNLKLPQGTVLIGEIGLGGQLRTVAQLSLRLQEAERLGFKVAIIPRRTGAISGAEKKLNLEIIEASTICEALSSALGINF